MTMQAAHAQSGDEGGGIMRRPTMQKAGQEILAPMNVSASDFRGNVAPQSVQNGQSLRASRQEFPVGLVEEFKVDPH
jgi:hypothetical protein